MIKDKIAKTINALVEKFGYHGQIEILPQHLDLVEEEELVFWSVVPRENSEGEEKNGVNDPLKGLFDVTFKDRKTDDALFYHYLTVEEALDLLENRQIRFSDLHTSSDTQEYLELYDQYHLFIPNGYKEGILLNRRQDVFVLPMIEKSDEHPFLGASSLAANKELALGFRLHSGLNRYAENWSFRTVLYGEARAFELAKEIQKEVLKQFGKKFIVLGFDKYSRFYKSASYKGDKEVRLCLDLMTLSDSFSQRITTAGIESALGEKGQLLVSLKNDFFELELVELVVKPQLADMGLVEIKQRIGEEVLVVQ